MLSESSPILSTSSGRPKWKKHGIISKLFFWYALPIILKGQKRELEIEDLEPNLSENDAKGLGDELGQILVAQVRSGSERPLLLALWQAFGKRILYLGVLQFVKDGILTISKNLLLGHFIVSFYPGTNPNFQLLYGVSLVFIIFVQGMLGPTTTYIAMHLGMKMRIAVSTVIYRKVLKSSQRAINETGIGKIINLLATDASILSNCIQYMHYVWIAPIVSIMSAALIGSYVGLSAFIGIGLTIAVIPLQVYSSKWFSILRAEIGACTDARLSLINSIFSGILLVKMYTWESPLVELVGKARAKEIHWMRRRALLNATMNSLFQVLPRVALFSTLVAFVWSGNLLDAATAFVSMSLFSLVSNLVSMNLPGAIVVTSEAMVAVTRINDYLVTEEHNNPTKSYTTNESTAKVILEAVSTKWSEKEEESLQNVSLELTPGKFICLLGNVGAGKSTLLLTILHETLVTSGRMLVQGTIGYAAQSPSIFPGSIRDNILFGNSFDSTWYDEVVEACALRSDFEFLPHGDLTLVADKGASLSGGQKARIGLARAVYLKADIYLLDDPLCAVDSGVGRHILNKCILRLLKSKSILLTTHSPDNGRHADEIIMLDKGILKIRGTYDELSARGHIGSATFDKMDDEVSQNVDEDARKEVKGVAAKRDAETEQSESGSLKFGLAWKYFRFGNSLAIVGIGMFLNITSQAVLSFSDLYLQIWTKRAEFITVEHEEKTTWSYATVYSLLLIPLLILPILRSLAHYLICFQSAVQLHSAVVRAVIWAPMRFFLANPMGRILNRVSKDMGILDEPLQGSLFRVIWFFLQTVGNLLMVNLMNPVLIIPSILHLVVFRFVHNFYRKPASRIARLESVYKSPVFGHMSSTLHSLITIRAYNAQQQFADKFDDFQNIHSSASRFQLVTTCWFEVIIQLLAFVFFTVVCISFLLISKDPAKVALGVVSTLDISAILGALLSQSANLSNRLVSVERILDYTRIRSENNKPDIGRAGFHSAASGWPNNGRIQIHDARIGYTLERDVLQRINFVAHPQEKIGIVGRTGAGKTTLVGALFRIFELKSGSIHIDGIDISKLNLHELRSRLSIIPQDPILFQGSLRLNLDPFSAYDDSRLWESLKDTNLAERISKDGLETQVDEKGNNFSQGERQLISFARALLKKTKILVLDEATAHIDGETDAHIQQLLKKKFSSCTVLTIAHRLGTILDSDRICVLEAGNIVEFDTPSVLLENKASRLSEFVRKTNLKRGT